MHVCVVDAEGRTQKHVNLPCDPGRFLKVIEPYRERLVVGCECLFAWYWLADLCREQGITFVLDHALYIKAIHGGKTKNDKINSEKIARLLRGGMLPQSADPQCDSVLASRWYGWLFIGPQRRTGP